MISDRWIAAADAALKTLFATPRSKRPVPGYSSIEGQDLKLTATERSHAGALMRVNHVGEICAQALYAAQSLTAKSESTKRQLIEAAQDEADHLAWTHHRLQQLDARPSLLNPVWYAGSFALGLIAGAAPDKVSLGFVVETEKQVESHLASHLSKLPANDGQSRAIVLAMQADEAKHGQAAMDLGASPLPKAVQKGMQIAAKAMTTIAQRV